MDSQILCPAHRTRKSQSERQKHIIETLIGGYLAPSLTMELSTSLQAYQHLKENYNPDAEEVWILALNSQMKLVRKDMLFRGTVDHCLLHPRDVLRALVLANASSFILAHNHPSDCCLPSEQDLALTRKLHTLAQMIQIPLNDHIIMTSQGYFSMADHGYFLKWKKKKSGTWIY